MKNITKIAGILVVLVFAANLNVDAQRGMRKMKADSSAMKSDSSFMHMRRNMPMMMDRKMMHPGFGMRHMGGPGMMARDWRGKEDMMHGMRVMRMIENIPDLTEKQKEDLKKAMDANHQEMQNLREKHQKEMQDIHDAHRKKVMSILTDDQKKELLEKLW